MTVFPKAMIRKHILNSIARNCKIHRVASTMQELLQPIKDGGEAAKSS